MYDTDVLRSLNRSSVKQFLVYGAIYLLQEFSAPIEACRYAE